MLGTPQPIVLLADSQLLFWCSERGLFLSSLRDRLEAKRPRAAYVGASNGDRREFFDLFRGAMEGAGIDLCRQIPSRPGREDLDFFDDADLILLSGGDPLLGWQTLENNGLAERLVERYHDGALLMGISAGAMQLGLYGVGDDVGEDGSSPFETLGLVPFLVDVHDEPGWHRLRRQVSTVGGTVRGLGIPSGGGALVQPDHRLEPVRHPLVKIGPWSSP